MGRRRHGGAQQGGEHAAVEHRVPSFTVFKTIAMTAIRGQIRAWVWKNPGLERVFVRNRELAPVKPLRRLETPH
jgi:hypothetical protein